MAPSYVGRFAPTPSGPLHYGSIVAALGSYLDARANHGQWLLRMDDIDAPRVVAGASESILATLDTLGLHWDGQVLYQSQRKGAYRQALAELQSKKMLYPCFCPRKLIKGKPYPGTCKTRENIPQGRHSLRIITTPEPVSLRDKIQGDMTLSLVDHSGDFIVHRSDGQVAYNLAVVIDDQWQGVSHIVRGADLFTTTQCQIYLQQQLGYPTPNYSHLPVAVDQTGRKISKTDRATDVLMNGTPEKILVTALGFLGQSTAEDLQDGSIEEIIQAGIDNWQMDTVPKCSQIRI